MARMVVECSPSATEWLRVRSDVGESGIGEVLGVFGDVRAPAMQSTWLPIGGPIVGGEVVVGDEVADADAAAGLQNAVNFGEDSRFVRGEVDHAVGDDDVDAGVG